MTKPKIPAAGHKVVGTRASPAIKLRLLPAIDSPVMAGRLARDLRLIADSMAARGMKIPGDIAGFGLGKPGSLTDIPGVGLNAAGKGRRIGDQPGASPGAPPGAGQKDTLGFTDPLDGRRGNKPRSKLVGPGAMPGPGDLAGQDTGHSSNGSDSPRKGWVWQDRHTERQSSDGTQTWGSTSYRDYSGNHWRVDYHDERRADGSLRSTDTVYDGHNVPVKTTVREGNAAGAATETTTFHSTGEVKTASGTMAEIFPERSQTAEGAERGGPSLAPRGWANPVTGVVRNGGLATGNNQVNPGREDSPPPAASPLVIDPRILVVNPAPDSLEHPDARPRDIRGESETIIDPPRPPI